MAHSLQAGRFILRVIRDLLLIVGITALLFAGANGVAYLILPQPSWPYGLLQAIEWPGSPRSLQLYRDVFGLGTDEDPMGRFKASPRMVMHPTLPFAAEQVNNRFFRIGIEGIRYAPGWDDPIVRDLLAHSSSLIFAIGGSTTLGHGLAGDETWPYFLNRLLAENGDGGTRERTVVNFGAPAYDQRTEIDKLIYLLRAGYRPAKVVLLDGWNDLFLARSNMRLVDKVIYHGFAQGRGEVAFTPGGFINQPSSVLLALENLPLWRLIEQRTRPALRLDAVKFDRDAFVDGFDFREAAFMHRHWAPYGEAHLARFKEEIVDYYRGNLKLLQALAAGYGFTARVFYQPNGLLDPTNPFVPAAARDVPGYRYIAESTATVRAAIARRDLDMIDISDALDGLDAARYLDVAHYTPAANREIARRIGSHLQK